MEEKILSVLDELRPALQQDGGDVEYVAVNEEGIVAVRLVGACGGCPMATLTLKNFIEAHLVEKIEGVKGVVQVP